MLVLQHSHLLKLTKLADTDESMINCKLYEGVAFLTLRCPASEPAFEPRKFSSLLESTSHSLSTFNARYIIFALLDSYSAATSGSDDDAFDEILSHSDTMVDVSPTSIITLLLDVYVVPPHENPKLDATDGPLVSPKIYSRNSTVKSPFIPLIEMWRSC